jgi:hypothetical protein
MLRSNELKFGWEGIHMESNQNVMRCCYSWLRGLDSQVVG